MYERSVRLILLYMLQILSKIFSMNIWKAIIDECWLNVNSSQKFFSEEEMNLILLINYFKKNDSFISTRAFHFGVKKLRVTSRGFL